MITPSVIGTLLNTNLWPQNVSNVWMWLFMYIGILRVLNDTSSVHISTLSVFPLVNQALLFVVVVVSSPHQSPRSSTLFCYVPQHQRPPNLFTCFLLSLCKFGFVVLWVCWHLFVPQLVLDLLVMFLLVYMCGLTNVLWVCWHLFVPQLVLDLLVMFLLVYMCGLTNVLWVCWHLFVPQLVLDLLVMFLLVYMYGLTNVLWVCWHLFVPQLVLDLLVMFLLVYMCGLTNVLWVCWHLFVPQLVLDLLVMFLLVYMCGLSNEVWIEIWLYYIFYHCAAVHMFFFLRFLGLFMFSYFLRSLLWYASI